MTYEKKTAFPILDNECWWGGVVAHGQKMPLTKDCEYSFDCCKNRTGNPYMGLFTSNQGRYLFVSGPSSIQIKDGTFTVFYSTDIELSEGHGTLKNAYLAATKKYFMRDIIDIPVETMTRPQFCTWAEMDITVSQEKIENYANSIKKNGFPYGVLIIDDGWSKDYGDWTFNEEKFPNPKEMIEKLHAMGFVVEIWLVPFVNQSVPDYQLLCDNNALIRDNMGAVAQKEWWNGTSALLDLTSPFAWTWLKEKLDWLIKEYNVDGFKFDAGGEQYYSFEDVTAKMISPSEHTDLWAKFANQYRYNELRQVFGYCGQHFVLRLNDKRKTWNKSDGLGALVPHCLHAGICAYPFSCPDMIGGGQIEDFRKATGKSFDYELISRFCECSALLPSMQFSHAYWEQNEDVKNLFLKYALLHTEMEVYLLSLIEEAKKTFAPIVRYLEYEFPNQGFERECNVFMFGSEYLVAPIIEQGEKIKVVRLPNGVDWEYMPTGVVYSGGHTVTVDATVGVLPYFRKIRVSE